MRKAYIATQQPSWRQVHTASQSVRNCSRKFFIEAHITCTHRQQRIGVAISETQAHIQQCVVASVCQYVYLCLRTDVHQSYPVRQRIATVIDNAELQTLRLPQRNVQQSYLHTSQRVGIVIGAQLQATHCFRYNICQTAYLNTSLYAHCYIRETAQLQTSEGCSYDIGKSRQLNTVYMSRHVGDGCQLQTAHFATQSVHTESRLKAVDTTTACSKQSADAHTLHLMVRNTAYSAYLKTVQGVGGSKNTDIRTSPSRRVCRIVSKAQSPVIEMTFGSLPVCLCPQRNCCCQKQGNNYPYFLIASTQTEQRAFLHRSITACYRTATAKLLVTNFRTKVIKVFQNTKAKAQL